MSPSTLWYCYPRIKTQSFSRDIMWKLDTNSKCQFTKLVWCSVFLWCCIFRENVLAVQYTHDWAIDVHGGRAEADLVAKDTGCINQGRKTDFALIWRKNCGFNTLCKLQKFTFIEKISSNKLSSYFDEIFSKKKKKKEWEHSVKVKEIYCHTSLTKISWK